MNSKFVIIGNPNSGKSTFFNSLTNAKTRVGNWNGVTTEISQSFMKFNDQIISFSDLPGIYSLSGISLEEKSAIHYILNNDTNYLCLIDPEKINRGLYLALQMIEAGKKVTLILNTKKKIIDTNLISNLKLFFGNVYALDVSYRKKCIELVGKIINDKNRISHLPYLKNFNDIATLIDEFAHSIGFRSDFCAMKYVEKDADLIDLLHLPKNIVIMIENKTTQQNLNIDSIAQMRYDFIDTLLKECEITKFKNTNSILDSFILNKFLCVPIFLSVVLGVFYLTFGPVGSYLSSFCYQFIVVNISQFFDYLFNLFDINYIFVDFWNNVIIGCLGTVFSFVPQICLLFFCINLLEQSGYLPRLAYLLNDILAKIGINGKYIFTMLLGLGCTTTAIITAKNLDNKESMTRAIMLTNYIPCSARLPIIVVLVSAMFSGNYMLIFGLYLLSICVMIFVAYVTKSSVKNTGNTNFLIEIPNYQIPKMKILFVSIYENIMSFLNKIIGVLLILSAIIWLLESFNWKFEFGADDNILKSISIFVSPIFAPLGFNNWGAVSALIAGVVAKELIVGSLAIINGIGSSADFTLIGQSLIDTSSVVCFSPASAISFLIFAVLYIPCISSISIMSNYIGKRKTVELITRQLFIAYFVSFVFYNVIIGNIALISITSIILVLLYLIYSSLTKSSACYLCPALKRCRKHRN